jgi:hypothetical protein
MSPVRRIKLQRIFKQREGQTGTRLIWFRIGTQAVVGSLDCNNEIIGSIKYMEFFD